MTASRLPDCCVMSYLAGAQSRIVEFGLRPADERPQQAHPEQADQKHRHQETQQYAARHEQVSCPIQSLP
jgi:hypothetical protein